MGAARWLRTTSDWVIWLACSALWLYACLGAAHWL